MAKKEIKPTVIVVDITDATCAMDVYYAFACAKIDNTLTADEAYAYDAINDEFEEKVIDSLSAMADSLHDEFIAVRKSIEAKQKKPNIFVRFWNWITGK